MKVFKIYGLTLICIQDVILSNRNQTQEKLIQVKLKASLISTATFLCLYSTARTTTPPPHIKSKMILQIIYSPNYLSESI